MRGVTQVKYGRITPLEEMAMFKRRVLHCLTSAFAALGVLLLAAGSAAAQTSTGTIRGTITSGGTAVDRRRDPGQEHQ